MGEKDGTVTSKQILKKCPVISSKTDHMVRTTQKSSPTQLGSHQITLLCEAD